MAEQPAPLQLFQSTPPVKAATFMNFRGVNAPGISIHAAREGGDAFRLDSIAFGQLISIHAAREGGDPPESGGDNGDRYFNPRRP